MGVPDQPIGAPASGLRTETRTYDGPSDWAAPRLVRDLEMTHRVEVVRCTTAARRFGTRQRMTVRARGYPADLRRFWIRVNEIADASKRGQVPESVSEGFWHSFGW